MTAGFDCINSVSVWFVCCLMNELIWFKTLNQLMNSQTKQQQANLQKAEVKFDDWKQIEVRKQAQPKQEKKSECGETSNERK